jgi:hypothetical protein
MLLSQIRGPLLFLKTENVTPVSPEDCAWANPFLQEVSIGGFDSDLFTVQSKKTSGELLKDTINKVGEIRACLGQGFPATERGLLVADFGIVWDLSLNGQSYLVGGGGRFRTNPPAFPPNFPEPGMSLAGTTGTIVIPPNVFTPVGSMSGNTLGNEFGIAGYEDGSLITVRLYAPVPNANGN